MTRRPQRSKRARVRAQLARLAPHMSGEQVYRYVINARPEGVE